VLKVRDTRGFTIGELLVVMAIIFVVGAMAIALLKRARISANESSAVGSIRSIVSAQASYSSFNRGFAGSLQTLSARCSGMDAGFVSADLNQNGVVKSGYILSVVPGAGAKPGTPDCNGTTTYSVFYATARPEIPYDSGERAFAANATATVWQNTAGAPPPEPLTPSATVSVIGK
jgi:type IV pilus assembly protein PilA